jgi:hypothetical protein
MLLDLETEYAAFQTHPLVAVPVAVFRSLLSSVGQIFPSPSLGPIASEFAAETARGAAQLLGNVS